MIQVDKTGVHVHHCCLIHGCKYSGMDVNPCPVKSGQIKQAYRCEYCDMDWEDWGKPKCGVVFGCKSPGYWRWQGRATKVLPGVGSLGIFFYLCDHHDAEARKPSSDVFAVPLEKRIL